MAFLIATIALTSIVQTHTHRWATCIRDAAAADRLRLNWIVAERERASEPTGEERERERAIGDGAYIYILNFSSLA